MNALEFQVLWEFSNIFNLQIFSWYVCLEGSSTIKTFVFNKNVYKLKVKKEMKKEKNILPLVYAARSSVIKTCYLNCIEECSAKCISNICIQTTQASSKLFIAITVQSSKWTFVTNTFQTFARRNLGIAVVMSSENIKYSLA